MRYFERGVGFVSLAVAGDRLVRRWGAIGGAGGSHREEPFEDTAEAAAAMARQAGRLERKGYEEGHRHAGLYAAILAAPDDPGPRLVYADWLLEQGDPRGKLIALTSEGSRPRSESEAQRPRAESESLDAESVEAWLNAHPQLQPPWWRHVAQITWRLGYVDTLTMLPVSVHYACSSMPVALQRILRHPSGRLVRQIILGERMSKAWRAALEARPARVDRVVLRRSDELVGDPPESE